MKPETKLIYAAIGRIENGPMPFTFSTDSNDLVTRFANECLDNPDFFPFETDIKYIIDLLEHAAILAELGEMVMFEAFQIANQFRNGLAKRIKYVLAASFQEFEFWRMENEINKKGAKYILSSSNSFRGIRPDPKDLIILPRAYLNPYFKEAYNYFISNGVLNGL